MKFLIPGLALFLLVTTNLHASPAIGPFLESETPFLNSALIINQDKPSNLVRRGVLIPLGGHRWACFDTALLRCEILHVSLHIHRNHATPEEPHRDFWIKIKKPKLKNMLGWR